MEVNEMKKEIDYIVNNYYIEEFDKLNDWDDPQGRKYILEQIKSCVEWIEQKTKEFDILGKSLKTKGINKTYSSYSLKHIIENEMGMYVSNPATIIALRICGFTLSRLEDSPNAGINISMRVFRNQRTY